jgi:hypothetical protein
MGNDWIAGDEDTVADEMADEMVDAEYRALLREVSGAVPVDRVDWDVLHARVERAAGGALAERRHHQERARRVLWWEYAARGRVMIPVALAASLVLAAYVGFQSTDASVGVAPVPSRVSTGDVRDAFEASVTGAVPSRRVAVLLVSSPADADALGTDDTTR